MSDPHTCDFWPDGSGALVCACGKSSRPIVQDVSGPAELQSSSTSTEEPK